MSNALTFVHPVQAAHLPALFTPTTQAAKRTPEFFTAQMRNPNTCRTYARAVSLFASWCAEYGPQELQVTEQIHVAAYIEGLQAEMTAPSIKLQLAALRVLFDGPVVAQVLPVNPAASVRGFRYSVKKGKTPVLADDEARTLIGAIDILTITRLRDRAVIKMQVEDVYVQGWRIWIRLQEKGGKQH